jgi:hypothetical protein
MPLQCLTAPAHCCCCCNTEQSARVLARVHVYSELVHVHALAFPSSPLRLEWSERGRSGLLLLLLLLHVRGPAGRTKEHGLVLRRHRRHAAGLAHEAWTMLADRSTNSAPEAGHTYVHTCTWCPVVFVLYPCDGVPAATLSFCLIGNAKKLPKNNTMIHSQ